MLKNRCASPRQLVLFVALGLWLLIAATCVAAEDGAAAKRVAKPNVILVLLDDLGWSDLSCFGDAGVKTAHIDRLAGEGLRFTQFYVNAPICSPSRCSLTTGQYPQRWRITSYLAARQENEKRGMAQWLDPKATTLPRLLHDAGYATGHFGKWHLGGQRDVGEAPGIDEYGFDRSLTNFEGMGPRILSLCDAHDGKPPKRHALGSDTLGRGPITWVDRSLVTKSFVDATIAFIEQAERDGKPYYVNVWPDDVHGPWFPPANRRGDGSKRALYEGVVVTADEQLGALFDFVRDDPKRRANTVILLCSDNGPEPKAGSSAPLRGQKGYLYEGGIRSPLVVWGPGILPSEHAGTRNESAIMAAMDLVPSLLTLTGVDGGGAQVDGEDCSAALFNNGPQGRTSRILWRRPPDRPPPADAATCADLAVRNGRWKLLCAYDGSHVELYDLNSDAVESVNLADKHPDVVKPLVEAVLAWHESLPPDNGADFVGN